MKTIIFYLAFLLVSILLTLSSNAKQNQVNLKVNQKLIYEWTEKEVYCLTNQKPVTEWVQVNRFSLLVTKISENKLFFSAQMLKKTEKFPQSNAIEPKDFAFPQLINDFWELPDRGDTPEEILYQVQFKFELDLNTNSVQLINRPQILEQCRKILSNKGYSDQISKEIIETINSTTIQLHCDLFLKPFLLLNTDFDQTRFKSEKLGADLIVQKRNSETIELKSSSNSVIKLNCQLNSNTGLLTNIFEERPLVRLTNGFSPIYAIENPEFKKVNQLSLKSSWKSQNLIVCGHIEDPINDHIVLYTINRAFGNKPYSKDVYLDKAGDFRIDTKLQQNGLAILVQPNKMQNINTAAFLLYVEPGDSIYLKTSYDLTKKTTLVKCKSVEFSGDHKAEAEFLMKYQEEWGLPPYNTSYNNFQFNDGNKEVEIYLKALDKLEELLPLYKKKMSPETAIYLEHELQALLYSRLFEALPDRTLPRYINSHNIIIPSYLENIVKSRLDTFDIQRIYNDYGIFSRDLLLPYVRYKHQQLFPVIPITFEDIFQLPPKDLDRMINFTKIVLNGSPLYETLSQQLSKLLTGYNSKYNSKVVQSFALETFTKLQKRSNNISYNHEIESLFSSQWQWKNSRYVPDIKFIDLQKKETRLRSFINEKPAIVFAGSNWSNARYAMDDGVKKHPELNFVLINEGFNFDLWKGWNDRANSFSQQLFLLNDSIRLTDIFLEKLDMYIIYNLAGERIGVEKDLEKAVLIATESLKPKKKEIDRSMLTGIIVILVFILLLSLVAFLIFKLRMKQRLKKQTQEKRLRELQMAAIRAQMNPHFLFNSLNSVQNLIQQNKSQEAHLYLSDFAGLIRKVLRNSDKEEVSLAEELETLEQYLNLEKLRFDFDFSIVVDQEIDQNLFMLPSMILQPIAENALIHGLQNKTGDKMLSIRITKVKNAIQIIIEDNGIGIEASKKIKTNSNGVGLRMNEERIQMMKEKYGGNYSFKLTDLSEQNTEGTRVEIIIPEEV